MVNYTFTFDQMAETITAMAQLDGLMVPIGPYWYQ